MIHEAPKLSTLWISYSDPHRQEFLPKMIQHFCEFCQMIMLYNDGNVYKLAFVKIVFIYFPGFFCEGVGYLKPEAINQRKLKYPLVN